MTETDKPLQPEQTSVPPVEQLLDIEEFARVKLVVAEVISAEAHPNADRLIIIKVRIGDEVRQVVAGIRKWYDPATIVGKKIVVVSNLKPAKLRGVESNGMVLAAQSADDVVLLTLDRDVPSGSKIK